jgi:hypothetical protein
MNTEHRRSFVDMLLDGDIEVEKEIVEFELETTFDKTPEKLPVKPQESHTEVLIDKETNTIEEEEIKPVSQNRPLVKPSKNILGGVIKR